MTSTQLTVSCQTRMDESSPQGLPNIGNSCYINAVLQVLAASPRCTRVLQNSTRNLDKESVSRVTLRLLSYVNSVQGHTDLQNELRKLQYLISKSEKSFEYGKSNDVHYFLMQLIGKLKEEGVTEVNNLFRIELCDLIERKYCQCIEITAEQSFYSLTVPLSRETMSVKGGLDVLLQEEVITLNCNRCGDNEGPAKKMIYIRELPDLLVLQLPRFKEGSTEQRKCLVKMCNKISFSHDLEFKDADHKRHTYKIYGLIEHIGDLHCGHYTAYVLKFFPGHRQVWYRCSDEEVAPVPEDYVYSLRDVYLLFYARI